MKVDLSANAIMEIVYKKYSAVNTTESIETGLKICRFGILIKTKLSLKPCSGKSIMLADN